MRNGVLALQRVQEFFDRVRLRVDETPPLVSGTLLFVGLLALYALTATYDMRQSPDPLAAAIPAWQFAVHGNLNLDEFQGALRWFVDGQHHVASDRMPGVIFFGIPFYWLLPTSSEGVSLAPAALAAATASAGALTLLHIAFRRLVAPSTALMAALLAGLGTATWTVSADALWPHGINQLWFSAVLLLVGSGAWATSGLFLALAVFTRPNTAVVAAVVGLHGSWTHRSVRPAILVGLISLVGVGALAAYNVWMFGELALAGGYFRRADPLLPPSGALEYGEAVLGTLVSPDRGLLVLSPFLVLLLPGLARAWRLAPAWVRGAALAGVAYMLVQLALNRFSGGDNFFSYRLPLEMLTLAAPLLVLSWREWTSRTVGRRRAFVGLGCLAVLVHALGALYWTPTYDERSPWTSFKVFEAAQAGGLAAVSLAVGIAGIGLLLMTRSGRTLAP